MGWHMRINFQTMYHVKNTTTCWKVWNDKILQNNLPICNGKKVQTRKQYKKQKYNAISIKKNTQTFEAAIWYIVAIYYYVISMFLWKNHIFYHNISLTAFKSRKCTTKGMKNYDNCFCNN